MATDRNPKVGDRFTFDDAAVRTVTRVHPDSAADGDVFYSDPTTPDDHAEGETRIRWWREHANLV